MNYKLNVLLRLKQLNNNLSKINKKVINEVNNNLVKMLRISDECNALEEKTDKQRHCDKRFICFWPKCQYKTTSQVTLDKHISYHLNERQFNCNECNSML